MTVVLLYPQHSAHVQREYNVAARISGHNFGQSTVRLEVQASLADLSTQKQDSMMQRQRRPIEVYWDTWSMTTAIQIANL